MKYLFSLLALFFSTQLFAASLELGKYIAVPKDFPSAAAIIDLKADATVTVKIEADDTKVNCEGTYKFEEFVLSAHVYCDNPQAPELNVTLDLTNVTPENLRSESGVEVSAKFDLLGDDPAIFILKKAD